MICLPEHRYWLPKPNKGTSNKSLSLPNTPKPNQSSTRKLKQWSIDKPNDRVVGCTFYPYGWLYFLSKLFSPQGLSIELSVTHMQQKWTELNILNFTLLVKKHYSVHSYQFKTLRKWLNIIINVYTKDISLPWRSFYFRTMVLSQLHISKHPFFPWNHLGVFPMNRWNISVRVTSLDCNLQRKIGDNSPLAAPQDATGCDF